MSPHLSSIKELTFSDKVYNVFKHWNTHCSQKAQNDKVNPMIRMHNL